MTDEGKPLQPEHIFKRVTWRGTLSIAGELEKSTTWTLTGVAAIVGLFIANLDSASKIVSAFGLRWSLILFALSLLAAAISKQIGIALQGGLRTVADLETLLNSEAGKKLVAAMTVGLRQVMKEIAAAFVWPLSSLMSRAGESGLQDYLSADRRLVRLFCWQVYFNALHSFLAAAGLVLLAASVRVG